MLFFICPRPALSFTLIFLLDIYIFSVDEQRPEGLAAFFVEPSKELQTLEPQIVDIAAQQIQHEVQRVSYQGDDNEACHRAAYLTQGIKDLRDDAASQH